MSGCPVTTSSAVQMIHRLLHYNPLKHKRSILHLVLKDFISAHPLDITQYRFLLKSVTVCLCTSRCVQAGAGRGSGCHHAVIGDLYGHL